ncbi:hypothetical protein M422DRAFT_29081 [Sphaerobolus stellatus SS14]|uniref:Uncharacterized protein n=1 Tax=Sphaerobolus stellatus (strain SS14) TaxID=990650 RepID=A0A0C9W3Y7_SPHS4|nr:hypothetical protein M422DRAFT_39519 [Sphaerobolus stellatus SS14]KIJ46892.1 hypothetical protein M422DRAFT_29081 [Sphaerobolus stellatus SS14]
MTVPKFTGISSFDWQMGVGDIYRATFDITLKIIARNINSSATLTSQGTDSLGKDI